MNLGLCYWNLKRTIEDTIHFDEHRLFFNEGQKVYKGFIYGIGCFSCLSLNKLNEDLNEKVYKISSTKFKYTIHIWTTLLSEINDALNYRDI